MITLQDIRKKIENIAAIANELELQCNREITDGMVTQVQSLVNLERVAVRYSIEQWLDDVLLTRNQINESTSLSFAIEELTRLANEMDSLSPLLSCLDQSLNEVRPFVKEDPTTDEDREARRLFYAAMVSHHGTVVAQDAMFIEDARSDGTEEKTIQSKLHQIQKERYQVEKRKAESELMADSVRSPVERFNRSVSEIRTRRRRGEIDSKEANRLYSRARIDQLVLAE